MPPFDSALTTMLHSQWRNQPLKTKSIQGWWNHLKLLLKTCPELPSMRKRHSKKCRVFAGRSPRGALRLRTRSITSYQLKNKLSSPVKTSTRSKLTKKDWCATLRSQLKTEHFSLQAVQRWAGGKCPHSKNYAKLEALHHWNVLLTMMKLRISWLRKNTLNLASDMNSQLNISLGRQIQLCVLDSVRLIWRWGLTHQWSLIPAISLIIIQSQNSGLIAPAKQKNFKRLHKA